MFKEYLLNELIKLDEVTDETNLKRIIVKQVLNHLDNKELINLLLEDSFKLYLNVYESTNKDCYYDLANYVYGLKLEWLTDEVNDLPNKLEKFIDSKVSK